MCRGAEQSSPSYDGHFARSDPYANATEAVPVPSGGAAAGTSTRAPFQKIDGNAAAPREQRKKMHGGPLAKENSPRIVSTLR